MAGGSGVVNEKYGKNSNGNEMAGGIRTVVRKNDRKRPVRKAKTVTA